MAENGIPKSLSMNQADEGNLDFRLLKINKRSYLYGILLENPEFNLRRLANIRLFLGDSIKGGELSLPKMPSVFRSIGECEVRKLVSMGIKQKDLLGLLDKAYSTYFSDKPLQYGFSFEKEPKKDYDGAIKMLSRFFEPQQYFQGEIRGYTATLTIANCLRSLLDIYRITNIAEDFREFLSSQDPEGDIDDKEIFRFLRIVISKIREERDRLDVDSLRSLTKERTEVLVK